MMDLSRELASIMRDVLGESAYRKMMNPKGHPEFSLKRGQHKYLIVGEWGKTQYCYTPHRAKDGYFYTFEYVEGKRSPLMRTKKGRAQLARTGQPYSRMEIKHLTKSRSRRLAHSRAIKRYHAAVKRAGWMITPRGSLVKGDLPPAKAVPA